MAGYSGTPLASKLGIKAGCQLAAINTPRNYEDIVAPMPEGVKVAKRITSRTNIVHIFSTKKHRLAQLLEISLKRIQPQTSIWVSWPKKSSHVDSDVTEESIREIALPMGLVDIKVCAVDETWSGLKLVIRKENRK